MIPSARLGRFAITALLSSCAFIVAPLCADDAAILPAAPGRASKDHGSFSLSTATDASLFYGGARELVYSSGVLLSEIDWPVEPAVAFGQRLRIASDVGLELELSLAAALPGQVGQVGDSDYLNGDGTTKTHYSQHDAYLERAVLSDFSLGLRKELAPRLELRPFVLLSFMDLSWTARNGYLQYPSETAAPYSAWSADRAKTYMYGTGLGYTLDLVAPALGLELGYRFAPALTLRASFAASPFASASDTDCHYLRGLVFYDSVAGAWFYKPELSASFAPNARTRLELELAYLRFAGEKGGATSILDQSTGKIYSSETSDVSGIGISLFSAALSLRVSL
jgi:Outer membrane protease